MAKPKTEYEIRKLILKHQLEGLRCRVERQQKRTAFIKKNLSKILKLRMDGWPRTKFMPDCMKWMEFVYRAKLEGIYSLGTSNCDVIAQLNRFAKEIKKSKR